MADKTWINGHGALAQWMSPSTLEDLMRIGDVITDGTAGRVLFIDADVKLAQDAGFTYTAAGGLVAGGLTINGGVISRSGVIEITPASYTILNTSVGSVYVGPDSDLLVPSVGISGTTISFYDGKTYIRGKTIIYNGNAPASASATGTAGQIGWDSSYFYVCVSGDTWKRVAIATW